jgi:uncharacterized sulfatase
MLTKPVNRRKFLTDGLLATTLVGLGSSTLALKAITGNKRPNILWILAEDYGLEMGCYGDKLVQTPNLDRLASQGIRYTQAFTTAPVCSASRSALMTGMYQTTLGVHNHRCCREVPLPDDIPLLPTLFRQQGYYVTNCDGMDTLNPGKTDLNFKHEDLFNGVDWRKHQPDQPFMAQVNLFPPHRPFQRSSEHPSDASNVILPPYYPDHPVFREDWAAYLDSINEMDRRVGLVLESLEQSGEADNTLVLFISDNGRCNVRDKQFLYDGGIHVPLLIRYPGVLPAGVVSQDMVSGIDIGATLLSLAGISLPE